MSEDFIDWFTELQNNPVTSPLWFLGCMFCFVVYILNVLPVLKIEVLLGIKEKDWVKNN